MGIGVVVIKVRITARMVELIIRNNIWVVAMVVENKNERNSNSTRGRVKERGGRKTERRK